MLHLLCQKNWHINVALSYK